MGITDDIKRSFKEGGLLFQLIYINVGAFLICALFQLGMLLFKADAAAWLDVLYLPADLPLFIRQPWSVVTYMFLHAGVWHLLFNMLGLYWFGKLFLYFFSSRHLRGVYLLGGLCGGLLYMLAYNLFPYFQESLPQAHLVGASAAVLAIVIATAVKEPNYKIGLLFIGQVSLKYVAAFLVLFDILFIASDNAGGHLAHLGGALAGWWFAVGINKGYDLTKGLNAVLDFFTQLFSRKRFQRKPKMRVYQNKNSRANDYAYNAEKKKKSAEIDRILEKLKKSGYSSLSNEEKKQLFDASQRN